MAGISPLQVTDGSAPQRGVGVPARVNQAPSPQRTIGGGPGHQALLAAIAQALGQQPQVVNPAMLETLAGGGPLATGQQQGFKPGSGGMTGTPILGGSDQQQQLPALPVDGTPLINDPRGLLQPIGPASPGMNQTTPPTPPPPGAGGGGMRRTMSAGTPNPAMLQALASGGALPTGGTNAGQATGGASGPAFQPGAPTGSNAFNPSAQNVGGQWYFSGESQNPNQPNNVTTGATEQAAEQAWFNANPGYDQYNSPKYLADGTLPGSPGGPAVGGPGGTSQSAASAANGGNAGPSTLQQALQPGYLGPPTQVQPTFYGGTQDAQAQQSTGTPWTGAFTYGGAQPITPATFQGVQNNVAATAQQAAPVRAQQFGGTPYTGAYTTGGANLSLGNVDPNLLVAIDPSAAISQIQQGFAPVADQASRSLQQTLAEAGIVGGGAVQAQNTLQRNLASAIAPTLANAVQTAQGNVLSATGQQAGLGQQTALSNQGALNSLLQQYLGNRQQAGLANQGANLQAAIQNQNNTTGNNQFNASAWNNIDIQNQALMQQTGLFNAGNWQQAAIQNQNTAQQAGLANQQALNTLLSQYIGNWQQSNLQNAQLGTDMANNNANRTQQTGLFNASNANNANQVNAGAYNTTDAANMGAYNQAQQQLFQTIMQAYYNQMAPYQQSIAQQQGGSTGVAAGSANTFQVPTGTGAGMSGLFQALGQIYAPRGGGASGWPITSSGGGP